jgi:hypothetical protein
MCAAEQLDGVAGEEKRDVVPLLGGGAGDEEAQRGARRVLRSVGHVDQDLRHARIVGARACGYLGGTLGSMRIQICGPVVAEVDGARVEGSLPGRQGRLLFVYVRAGDVIKHERLPGRLATLSSLLGRRRRRLSSGSA